MASSSRWSAAASLAVALALLSGCRGSEPAAAPSHGGTGDRPTVAAKPAHSPSPTASHTKKNPCAKVHGVRATYVVHSEPTATGQQIWLTLRLRNKGDASWNGETAGELFVSDPDPGQAAPVIEWGGSSEDGIGVRGHATSTHQVLNIAGRKLKASRTARVTLLGEYTQVWGHHVRGCNLPAHMRAPKHLVVAHPDGRWFLSAHKGEHIRMIGFQRNLAQNN